MKAGENGQENGGIERADAQEGDPFDGRHLVEQDRGHSGDLRQGVSLSKKTGRELAPARSGIEDCGNQQDAHISAEDENRNGGRDEPLVHEHKKESAQEQFVGYRIQILAEHGALLEDTRQGPVECVCEAGGHEKSKGEGIARLQNSHDKKRRNAYAQQREEIGSRAEQGEMWARVVVHGRFKDVTAPAFEFQPDLRGRYLEAAV